MKIMTIGLITLAAVATTSSFAVMLRPIPPLSAQEYIKIEKHRVNSYESALKVVLSNYSQLLINIHKLKDYKEILNNIAKAIESARKPYAPLILKDLNALTSEEQVIINQLIMREQKALKSIAAIESKTKKWAARHDVEYPENLIMY